MNRIFKILATFGGCTLFAVNAPAQHQHYDKATPPAKQGTSTTDSNRSDRPRVTTKNDRLTAAATRFKALDTDRDNRISRAEFTLAPNLGFPMPDAAGNNTGRSERKEAVGVTDSNITSRQGSSPVALFNELDTDQDGFLSQAELAAHHREDLPEVK